MSKDKAIPSLSPDHLMQPAVSEAEMRRGVVEQLEVIEKPVEDARSVAMRARIYTFDFDFTGKNGQAYRGRFTHTVPDAAMRAAIGVMRARLGGGLPFNTLDEFTSEMNMILADLSFTLDEKDRPPWAVNLRAIIDIDVIYALWEEVAEHEATFLGRRVASRKGS